MNKSPPDELMRSLKSTGKVGGINEPRQRLIDRVESAAGWASDYVKGLKWDDVEHEMECVSREYFAGLSSVKAGAKIASVLSELEHTVRADLMKRCPMDPFAVTFISAACEGYASKVALKVYRGSRQDLDQSIPLDSLIANTHAVWLWSDVDQVLLGHGVKTYAESFMMTLRGASYIGVTRVNRLGLLGALASAARSDQEVGLRGEDGAALTKRVTEWIEVLGGTLKDAAEDIAGHTYWGAKNRGALEAEAGILGQSVEVRHLWKRITQVLPVSIEAKGGSLAQWISSGPGGPMFFVKVGESMTGMNVESYSYETCLAEPIKTMTQAMLGQAEPNEIIEMLKNKEAWMCLAALGMSGVDEFESRLEQELEVCVLRSESVGTQKAYDKFRAQTEKKRLEAALREEGEQGSGRSGRL